MEIDYKVIGQRIKEERKKKGWSQELLSEKIDVSIAYINRVEKGSQINLKRLAQLSRVLEVDISYFITGSLVYDKHYLDKDLYEILIKCTPIKQRLIYNIAQIVCESDFI